MTPAALRKRLPRGEGERLRDEILAATEALLIESGSEQAVSIRAVAERVGVSPPAIYRHFEDKSHLIFDVCGRHFANLDAFLADAVAGIDDPVENVRARGRAYVRFGLENPEPYRILFMGRPHGTPAEWADHVLAASGPFRHLLEAVQACIDTGRFRTDDALAASYVLWSGVHGLTSLLIAKPDLPWPPRDEMTGLLCDSMLEGLLARSA
jgi:AcrR family transcriptional regulator